MSEKRLSDGNLDGKKKMNKVGILVGGVALAGAAVFVWQAIQPAPATQGHSMEPPDTSTIEDGDPIANVRVPAQLSPRERSANVCSKRNAQSAMARMLPGKTA